MRGGGDDRDPAGDEDESRRCDPFGKPHAPVPVEVEFAGRPPVQIERQPQRREHGGAKESELHRQQPTVGRGEQIGEAAHVLPRHHDAR